MLEWLEGLPISVWVSSSVSIWALPTVLTLHTMGMAVLVGASWVLDLRLLGIGTRVPLSEFRWLFRPMAVGLVVNLATGVLLFMQAATNWGASFPFLVKMVLVVAGGATMVLIRGHVFHDSTDPTDTGGRVRLLAVASILAWTAAVTAGRLLAYIV